MYVVSGSTHQRLGASLAEELDAEFCGVVNRHFPDGERYIRILMDVADQEVVVIQNTFPDKKIVELLLILQAVKEAGAKTVTCVIPYMGYSRQERIFQTGEARSAKAIAGVLGSLCDRIFTINVHTPAVLDFFGCEAHDINGSREVVRYLKGFKPDMVVAPDEGSKDRCILAADMLKVPVHVMKKVRIDGRTVETSSGPVDVKGSTAVILDDIISTGGTIATAANILRDGGADRILAACTHGLFIEDAANRLRVCDDILSSDTLEGVYTRFSVAPAIADAL
ncbi:MAG: ribose-phosphate diphosphokinase [Candidatus Thermoplasmatota archaeon]|nr:ribose-phosphate diphosphokinase [Candidatus Thermoplasmatota archaeon]MED6305925.1 ribose-phosphate diphosphokinase [Candidatus Thermoplasmatota archaeon]